MNIAIVLSGGVGSRMNYSECPKQYIEVEGKPILLYTIEKFELSKDIDAIVIVAAAEWQSKIKEWLDQYGICKVKAFALPGNQRQGSIVNGLKESVVLSHSLEDVVIIHDAARPLVSEKLIQDCLKTAAEHGGCMPVLPVTDTIYKSNNGEDINSLLDRSTLFAGQAPEAFNLADYAKLNFAASQEEIDAYKGTSEIAFRHGMTVKLIKGEDSNFKLTTIADLDKFKLMCKGEKI